METIIPNEVSSLTLADYCKNNYVTVSCPRRGMVARYEQYPGCLDTWVRTGSLDVLHLLDRNGKPVAKIYSLNKEGRVVWYNPNNEPVELFGGRG